MSPEHAANHADRAAVFLSRMLREKRIPEADRETACDLAIDLNLLAKDQRAKAGTPPPLPDPPITPL